MTLKNLLIAAFIIISTISIKAEILLDTALYAKNPNYIQEISLYEAYKIKQANIVMLGNSITHGCNWNELIGRTDIVERGVSSDIIEGFISRLEYIYKLKPKVVFIMGGINDIYNRTPVEDIFKNYTFLITSLKARNIQVVVQSTLFVNKKWKFATDRNKDVEKLNGLLESYCKNNKIEFLDLNPKMSSYKMLKDEFTYDGLHLTGKGYGVWGGEVEKMLKKLGM